MPAVLGNVRVLVRLPICADGDAVPPAFWNESPRLPTETWAVVGAVTVKVSVLPAAPLMLIGETENVVVVGCCGCCGCCGVGVLPVPLMLKVTR